jgi:uncharacterized repeat protein (TIGR02543 family)
MDDTRSKGVREGTGEGEKEGRKKKALLLLSLLLLLGAAGAACFAAGSAGGCECAPGAGGGAGMGGGGGGLPPVATYSVTFDADGGTPIAPQAVFKGETAHKPSDPAKAGMDFAGWYRDPALSVPWSFDDKVTGDMVLHAKWASESREAGPTYKVSFDAMGGSALPDATGIAPGSRIVAPPASSKTGHGLEGWYRDGALTERWDFSADRVTCDTTLYAGWAPETYAITYVFPVAGAEAKDWATQAGQATFGQAYSLMDPSARDPYAFGGWFLMPGGVNERVGDPSPANTAPYPDGSGGEAWGHAGDISLYAYWEGAPGLSYAPIAGGALAVSKGSASLAGPAAIHEYYLGMPVAAVADDAFKQTAVAVVTADPARMPPGAPSVLLHGGIKALGARSFAFCVSLASADLPASLEDIGDQAFVMCGGLNAVEIRVGTKTIGIGAFSDCGLRTGLTLPDGLEAIGDFAFFTTGPSSIAIPDSVTVIGAYTFAHCQSLASVTLSKNLKSIGDYALYDCSALTSIVMPLSVTYAGSHLFANSPVTIYAEATDPRLDPQSPASGWVYGIWVDKVVWWPNWSPPSP